MSKSRLLIGFLAGFVVGIFFGNLINLDLWWLIGIGAGVLLALILQWREQYWPLSIPGKGRAALYHQRH